MTVTETAPRSVRPLARGKWVVFSDDTDIPLLRLLRRGFRHCFVVAGEGGCWVAYDPLAHCTQLEFLDVPDGFDVPRWLEDQGMTVLKLREERGEPPRSLLPPLPFTCVEAVKRLVGLRAWWVFTPWQLYRALVRMGG